jgi:type I restriction enzyme M protein
MAIKKSQLYSTLWESCNALRGSMDASQYKDYVLMILFVKYLSDKARQRQIDLDVPDGCYFEDFVALKQNEHIGEKINEKLEAIREANVAFIGGLTLPNFNDDAKLGTGKTKVETLSKLIGEFQRDELDFSLNRAADDDLLGDAYEYLMKNFAAESGKSKGQFYTPAEVSRVMAKVLHMEDFSRAQNTIYDMTCGSGSLLLRALNETPNGYPTLYGQEKDSTTASLAKLNMLLHGIVSSDIEVGDTLNDPQFTTGSMLDTFDVCVANPPFSQKNWLASGGENDLYNRWNENLLPPAKCGDYAFLLHFVNSMKPETGRGACILPHGVLFRGNAEYTIRRYFVEKRYLKGIIGLPANLFFGTGIPACILILDKQNTEHREGIFFIDAKEGFIKDGNKNRLREQDIKRIVDAWNAQKDIPHYARMVEWSEIEDEKGNDFNLNIPRYIQPLDTEIQHDIDAHLHGGLPAHDVEAMDDYWTVCPSLKSSLFNKEATGRYSLVPDKDAIAQTISDDDSFKSQKQHFEQLLHNWKAAVEPKMLALTNGCHPKALIADWSEDLLQTVIHEKTLVDAYTVYDRLMIYWADTLQDDCYMISNDGWTLPADITPAKKNGIYSDIICDLLPVDILLNEFFTAEIAKIDDASQKVESIASDIDSLVEEQSEIFESFEKINGSVVKKAVKEAKQLGFDADTVKVLKSYLDLCKKKKDANSALSKLENELTTAVIAKYKSLSTDEIRNLVVEKKWLASVLASCMEEMQNVTQQLTSDVVALASRYENTLPSLSDDVDKYEAEVNDYLKEMGFEL